MTKTIAEQYSELITKERNLGLAGKHKLMSETSYVPPAQRREEFELVKHHYKLEKGKKEPTLAHKGDEAKHIMHVHYKGTHIGDISPQSSYKDTKKPGARIVTSRKNVTRWSVYVKPEHSNDTMNRYDRNEEHTSTKSALVAISRFHKKDGDNEDV